MHASQGDLTSLPASIGELKELTDLELQGCRQLQSLPSTLSSLTGLTKLDLRRCKQLESFPPSLGKLPKLTELRLDGCSMIPFEDIFKIPYRPSLDQALAEAHQRRAAFVVAQEDTLQQSMTAISWIAILMATASFIGFVQVPGGYQADGFVRLAGAPGPSPALNQTALLVYFYSDMLTFLTAIATVLIAVGNNMPRVVQRPSALDVITEIMNSCSLLLLTVVSGVITFVSGAFAVLPLDRWTLIIIPCVGGCSFILVASKCLIWRLRSIAGVFFWTVQLTTLDTILLIFTRDRSQEYKEWREHLRDHTEADSMPEQPWAIKMIERWRSAMRKVRWWVLHVALLVIFP